jgi:hypothetical protein
VLLIDTASNNFIDVLILDWAMTPLTRPRADLWPARDGCVSRRIATPLLAEIWPTLCHRRDQGHS